jgi:uncharacterized membrane protein YhaH (DUF805 family)
MKLVPEEPLGRGPFALRALGLLLLEHTVHFALLANHDAGAIRVILLYFPEVADGFARYGGLLLFSWMVLLLAITWALTVLSLRRVLDARLSPWIATLAFVPIVQIPVVLLLCLAPHREMQATEAQPADVPVRRARAITAAALLGVAMSLLTMVVGVLVRGRYEYGLFVLTPFYIGIGGGYIVNRRRDEGLRYTVRVVVMATLLSALALIAVALEGAICVVLAAPLALVAAIIGGLIGRAAARMLPWRRSNVIAGFVIMPLLLTTGPGGDQPVPFEMQSTVEIAAPPHAVWNALVHMSRIEEAPSLPFRLGVAYPLSGETFGEGVGTVRHGVFSTGIAVESVTVWQPDRVLAFRVLQDAPSMTELSPYDNVHSPHVRGYFTTDGGTFTLEAVGCNRTRLTERTRHELRIEPAEYWLPLARWIVKQNHARVLRHLSQSAVAASAGSGC